jgi:hypothetical protein
MANGFTNTKAPSAGEAHFNATGDKKLWLEIQYKFAYNLILPLE